MGQREPGIIPAAEWGEKPRETVTVKPAQAGSVRYAESCAWVFAITEAELQCCFHCARLPDGGRVLFSVFKVRTRLEIHQSHKKG